MPRLTPSQQRQIIRNATREMRRQGGTRRKGGGLFQTLGGKFGPLGELIGMLGDILAGGRRPGRRELEQAVEILSEQGFEIHPAGPPEPPPIAVQPPPVVRGPRQVPSVGTQPTGPTGPRAPAQPGRAPAAEPWPAEHGVQLLPARIRGAFENIPEDIEFMGWVLTPQSSNVYAVAWDPTEKILYVQFRAEGKPIGYKPGISLCSGKEYKIGIRPNVPGPIYSYGSRGRPVPQEVFTAIATSRSPGKVVWDRLRVCGSQWQHQVAYSLVDVPAGGRVPRKSTRRGLRVRTVPTIGQGRRGYRTSTLPERIR